ncbi:MAG TPA: hypothetical protein VN824_21480, partial [Puia sp.]|nr:hypothetical protein [Puia sp.]
PFSFPPWVFGDSECDIEVACRPAIRTRCAVSFELYDLAILYPCGYGNTDILPVDGEDTLVGRCCVCEADLQFGLVVLTAEAGAAAAASRAACCAAEEGFEEGREFPVVAVAAFVISIEFLEAASAEAAAPLSATTASFLLRLFVGFGVLPVFSVLIVFLSFFRVAQDFSSLVDLLKFLVCFLVVRIEVRVMFPGQFPVGGLDLVLGSGLVYP